MQFLDTEDLACRGTGTLALDSPCHADFMVSDLAIDMAFTGSTEGHTKSSQLAIRLHNSLIIQGISKLVSRVLWILTDVEC